MQTLIADPKTRPWADFVYYYPMQDQAKHSTVGQLKNIPMVLWDLETLVANRGKAIAGQQLIDLWANTAFIITCDRATVAQKKRAQELRKKAEKLTRITRILHGFGLLATIVLALYLFRDVLRDVAASFRASRRFR